MTLVDAYDKAQSLTLDDMEDFTDAFLVLRGMGGMNADDVRALRKEKVLTMEEGGDASWLIKNLNDTYIENIKSRLQKDIHKFSNIPDMSDESFTGNTSGVAIKYKLIGLEQVRSRKERCFKKGLQRRIELIAGMLDTKSRGRIDFRDIDIAFTANIPANTQEQSEIVKNLWGLVSQKSLLSLLPFVTDPAAEMDEVKKEREEDGAQDYANLGVKPAMNGGASGDGADK
jgi:SPP1 family phage portal protein